MRCPYCRKRPIIDESQIMTRSGKHVLVRERKEEEV